VRREVRILLDKELRQVRRSRAALASSTLLPLFLITLAPMGQLMAMRTLPSEPPPPPGTALPPGLAEALQDQTLFFLRFMLPLFIVLGGLIVPSIAATYTVVSEREKRTLDLLMALPVSVGDILQAKLLSMLVLAGAVVLPLFAIDCVILAVLGLANPVDLVLLLVLLAAAIICSLGLALLLALLARDFRTANNINGALLGPLIIVAVGVLLVVPGPAHYAVLVVLLLAMGALAFVAGLRWLTFERYLA
jgi:ABC-type transport system involved in multi-copper enzyme maturation permease subunit